MLTEGTGHSYVANRDHLSQADTATSMLKHLHAWQRDCPNSQLVDIGMNNV